jgi:enoyl-CoA hydratase
MNDELERAPLLIEFNDLSAVIRFNRPHSRNALSASTLQLLSHTLDSLLSREDLSAVIFTGRDDVFASGADIRELIELNAECAKAFSEMGQQLFQRIADARQITIAAINGYCMGGALDLALACDIRIASNNAVFAHPGTRLGIITGWGGTQRLPRVICKARALELFLTARRITGREALEMGFVSELADPVLDRALRIAAVNVS